MTSAACACAPLPARGGPPTCTPRGGAPSGGETVGGIGSSELYHISLSNRPGAARRGSLGRLAPGYQAQIVGRDGQPLPDGETGGLRGAGESAAVEYWNDPEKSARTFAGRWVNTGDLFRRDADGYYWYQGRADDLLKVGGIWVAPLEVEHCLGEHPAVVECAVIGVDEGGLARARAWVVLLPGEPPGEDLATALQAFVRARLAPH